MLATSPADRRASVSSILTNAHLVLPTEVVQGTVVVQKGLIVEVDHTISRAKGALDLAGDYLIPGLIELHTDSLERHYQPRSGVEWDAVSAAISHDTQIAGSGITTVYDSLTLGAASGWDMRAEMIGPIVDGLRTAIGHDLLRVQHFLHMRCEVTHPDIVPIFEGYADDPLVRFMSLMDHGRDVCQSPDMAHYRRHYLGGLSHATLVEICQGDEAAVDRQIEELLHGSRVLGPGNRRRLARIAIERRLAFANHDDASRAHIEEARSLGVTVTEFPRTLEAAEAAHAASVKVLMGTPNLIRGRSNYGNIAATVLAERNYLDILSSDYIPASLLPGAFRLAQEDFGWSLPRALATVTSVPAASAGLDDRGRLERGLRADLVRVQLVQNRPVVRAVWSGGSRVI
jgi:alpha-D-ribose 1-methylphosphonate 5-triphosphate diphosphatase